MDGCPPRDGRSARRVRLTKGARLQITSKGGGLDGAEHGTILAHLSRAQIRGHRACIAKAAPARGCGAFSPSKSFRDLLIKAWGMEPLWNGLAHGVTFTHPGTGTPSITLAIPQCAALEPIVYRWRRHLRGCGSSGGLQIRGLESQQLSHSFTCFFNLGR